MDVILIPGLWLDGSTWDEVVPVLEEAGHRAVPLTLPGLESPDADRSGITLRDHIDAVVAAVDAAGGEVAVVGHSLGGTLAYAAADERPDRIAHLVYVGSEPPVDSEGGEGAFPIVGSDVPLPAWEFFDDEMYEDLDDELRARLRETSVPSPARVTQDPLTLTDDRRRDIPATVVCCEYSGAQLREWLAEGYPGAQELGELRDVTYVDLRSGHWPQLSRPEDLGAVIVDALARS